MRKLLRRPQLRKCGSKSSRKNRPRSIRPLRRKSRPQTSFPRENLRRRAVNALAEDKRKNAFGYFMRTLRTSSRNGVLFTMCQDLEHAFEGDKFVAHGKKRSHLPFVEPRTAPQDYRRGVGKDRHYRFRYPYAGAENRRFRRGRRAPEKRVSKHRYRRKIKICEIGESYGRI